MRWLDGELKSTKNKIMSENDYRSRPTVEGLWEYLTYQFPETRGNIPLANLCKELRQDKDRRNAISLEQDFTVEMQAFQRISRDIRQRGQLGEVWSIINDHTMQNEIRPAWEAIIREEVFRAIRHKEVTETPRTDLAEENLRAIGGAGYVPARHARELERELIEKSANYALAHSNLGREVLECVHLRAMLEKARHQLLDRCGIDKDSDNAVALEINKALAEPSNSVYTNTP